MTLPQNSYVNSLWKEAKGEQTLLVYKALDNGLPFFPGYSINSKITRIVSGDKFIYKRQQTHTVLLDRPIRAAISITADKIYCLISLDVASVSYIQETQQTSNADLSAQIVETRKFKGKLDYELWDSKDFWYVSEQALHTQLVIPNEGAPTNKEYLQVLDQADLANLVNLQNDIAAPDVDYRLYRPLPSPLLPLPFRLRQAFKLGQETIEDSLRARLAAIDSGQQDWQITPIESYNSPTFPVAASAGNAALRNFLSLLLQDVTNFIIV